MHLAWWDICTEVYMYRTVFDINPAYSIYPMDYDTVHILH